MIQRYDDLGMMIKKVRYMFLSERWNAGLKSFVVLGSGVPTVLERQERQPLLLC